MAKATQKKAATAAPVSTTTNNPVLKRLLAYQENQGKLANLGSQLVELETKRLNIEAQINVLMGTPGGTQAVATTPLGQAVAASAGRKGNAGKTKAAPAEKKEGGAVRGPKTGNEQSLGDLLYDIVKDLEPTSVADLAKKAKDGGYKSSSENFPKVVRQVLSSDTRFRATKQGNNVLYSVV